jgi:KRAB domain-containing zinc finger protein
MARMHPPDGVRLPVSKRVKEECKVCGRMCTNLRKHVETIHMNMSPHACDQCDMRFAEKAALARHRCEVHGAEMKYECAECGRLFPHKGALTQHLTSHFKEVCPECGKEFSGGKAVLRRHMARIHTKKRDVTCTLCGEAFFVWEQLYRHQAKVHGVRGMWIYG